MDEYTAEAFHEAVKDAAAQSIAEHLALEGRRYLAGEMDTSKFLELVREADDMAQRVRGVE